jgi:hypothetical protein
MELFDTIGHARLGPVYAALDGAASYDELHLLRMVRIAENREGTDRSPNE